MKEILINTLPKRIFNGLYYRTYKYANNYDHRDSGGFALNHLSGRYFEVPFTEGKMIVGLFNKDDWYEYLEYHDKGGRPYTPSHTSFNETFGDDVIVYFERGDDEL